MNGEAPVGRNEAVRPIRIRNAARPMRGDQTEPSEVEGFTFVDIIVGLLIIGIVAAIAIFSVATLTHHDTHAGGHANTLPVCTNPAADEATQVKLAIRKYYLDRNAYPKSLQVLVTKKLLPAVPATHGPSASEGFRYNPENGTYATSSCSLG
jgi:competence protein ComGC